MRNGNRVNLVSLQVAELKEQLRALFQQWPDDRQKAQVMSGAAELILVVQAGTNALKQLVTRRRDIGSANFVQTLAPFVMVRHNSRTPL